MQTSLRSLLAVLITFFASGCALTISGASGYVPAEAGLVATGDSTVRGRVGRFCGLFGIYPGNPNARDLVRAEARAIERAPGAEGLTNARYWTKHTIIMGMVSMCYTFVEGEPSSSASTTPIEDAAAQLEPESGTGSAEDPEVNRAPVSVPGPELGPFPPAEWAPDFRAIRRRTTFGRQRSLLDRCVATHDSLNSAACREVGTRWIRQQQRRSDLADGCRLLAMHCRDASADGCEQLRTCESPAPD